MRELSPAYLDNAHHSNSKSLKIVQDRLEDLESRENPNARLIALNKIKESNILESLKTIEEMKLRK